jgi:bifunctional NMN adenylyltransferase/nudix hydrolase
LQQFSSQPEFKDLCDEFSFVRKYQSAWENAPYPPIFVTVDAVVVQSGHILLVRRKSRPGKGQLALPGGFVNVNESLLRACLRELKEETRLKVPLPVLKGSIVTSAVFDKPTRSDRGRTITHVYHMSLKSEKRLPLVKGGSDARDALWVPLGKLDSREMFEDHYYIIQKMLGMV